MKAVFLLFFILTQIICIGQSQNYNRYWITGYDYWHVPKDTLFGGSYIDFSEDPPNIYFDKMQNMNFSGSEAIISDGSGTLLFYSKIQ